MNDQERPQDEQAASDAMLDDFERRVDALSGAMAAQVAHVKKSTRRIQVFGFILVIAILAYLRIVFNAYAEIVTPETLAEMAQGRALDTLPLLSRTLEDALRKEAPSIAEQAKDLVIESLPKIREGMEKQMDAVADHLVDRLETNLDPMVESALTENKAEIDEMLKDLEDEDVALEVGKKLKIALAEKLAAEADTELDEFLLAMKAVETKLERLHSAKDLTPEEAFEKELIATWAIFLSEAMRESVEGEFEKMEKKEQKEEKGDKSDKEEKK